MTQQNVLKLLQKNRKWHLVSEISQKLGVQRSSLTLSLNKLLKQGEVEKKVVKGKLPWNYNLWRYK